ncbi:DUF7260 family protein [Haloplanus sp. C73]|uniref:DUF7260 family protein n=1 Tax=Haloplanus sp. C73 TaxID=3421641 RepID=UPI003EBAABAD
MSERIDAALDAVADERVSIAAERDALMAFDRRVADLSTVTVSVGPSLVADQRQSDRSLERVREVYAETVMSVPHYEEEYGDTLAESLAAEFGDDLAAALLNGAALTPTVRNAVRAAAVSARDEREEFLDVLDREAASLDAAASDVAAVRSAIPGGDGSPRRRFDDLRRAWSDLRDLEARIDGIARRRQETIRGHRSDLPGVPADLSEYLYADLPTPYPVLATLATVGERVAERRQRVERALASTA